MTMRNLTRFAAFVLLIGHARAQSVDSLVQEAFRNNTSVKSLEYQVQASGFRAQSAGALPAPTIGIEMSQVPTGSANVWNDAISNNLSVSQMFMLGGKLSAMSEVEKRKGKLLEENVGTLRAQVRARVKINYYQLWLIDRQIELQQRSSSLLSELIHSLQSQVLTNRMRQADLYSIQAELASEKAKSREMLAKRAGLQNTLNALLGRDDLTLTVSTDTAAPPVMFMLSETELSDRLRHTNPSLIAMNRMKEMNEAEIDATGKELYPDIMVQAMLMRMPNGMILTGGPRSTDMIQQSAAGMAMPRTDWMYSLMASISLPFAPWSSGRSTAKSDELRSTIQSLEAETNAMEREMLASLRSALSRFVSADSLAHLYETEILPLTRRAAEAQLVAYRTGQVPISTVLDSRRMEFMKQSDYLMVQVDRQMALADIEMMVGAPLQ
jgi:outer membrane protein, heavy metal efflux system